MSDTSPSASSDTPRSTADRSPDRFPDIAALDYEQARDELVQVVARLEAGAPTLEESLTLWERGEALAARCQQVLDGARERLDARTAADGPGDVGQDGPRAAGRGDDEEDA